VLVLLLTGVGILLIASNVGNLLYATLVERHPALLLTLNSTNRVLVGVTNRLDPVTYYGIGFIRLLVADPLFYLLGLFYGDAAIRWIERKAGDGATLITWFEKAFHKARYPIVLLAPNNPVCLLAGATGMRVPVFLALNTIGTIGRLYLARLFGKAFIAPISAVTGFLDRYRWPILGVSLVLFALQSAIKSKQGQLPGDLGALSELKDEIEATTAGEADGAKSDPGPGQEPEGGKAGGGAEVEDHR
jgi:membrane protein DedA with SNARE-associated domain